MDNIDNIMSEITNSNSSKLNKILSDKCDLLCEILYPHSNISDDTKSPYTINGLYVDFIPSGRR